MTRVQELKKKIAELSLELFNQFHWEYADNWYPRYPYVLVNVLPKEQRTSSGLYINVHEDAKRSNKVTLEGVVIKIWKADNLPIKTSLEIGDHVLFPHFAGQPFSTYSKDEFRLLREYIPSYENPYVDDGHIFAKVDFDNKDRKSMRERFFKDVDKLSKTYKDKEQLFNVLTKNYIIHPKESKTTSGL